MSGFTYLDQTCRLQMANCSLFWVKISVVDPSQKLCHASEWLQAKAQSHMQSGVSLGDLIVLKADELDSEHQTGIDTNSHVTVPSGCMQPCKGMCHASCKSGRCSLTSSRFTLLAKTQSIIQFIYIFLVLRLIRAVNRHCNGGKSTVSTRHQQQCLGVLHAG